MIYTGMKVDESQNFKIIKKCHNNTGVATRYKILHFKLGWTGYKIVHLWMSNVIDTHTFSCPFSHSLKWLFKPPLN
jgi:hypothetical protein